jgi:hypothetical protein
MTSAVLASWFLAGSLLAMLVPIATLIAIVIWGLLLIRRHERHRDTTQTGDGSAKRAAAAGRSPSGGAR